MQNFKQHILTEASVNTENVREGIITFINDSLLSASVNSATIQIGKYKIQNVVAVKPSRQHSTGGIAPYVDIDLILGNGSKIHVGIRVAKGAKVPLFRSKGLGKAAIPALFNGIHSLDKVYPKAREEFVSSLLNYYTDKGYTHGSQVGTVYGKIAEKHKEEILLGSPRYGGKCDYIITIDRVPFVYKRMSIPHMSTAFTGGGYVIKIKNARAFSAQEVMANNDVYMWAKTRNNRLYLGNDKVDMNNLPVIFGPPSGGDAKDFGIKKYKVDVNVGSKASFEIEDHKAVFKLELKSPNDLTPELDQDIRQDEIDVTPARDRGYGGQWDKKDQELDRSEYGSTLSPDERETIIKEIVDKSVRGMKHRFKEVVDKEQKYAIRDGLESWDDSDLKRIVGISSHRMAVEIRNTFL